MAKRQTLPSKTSMNLVKRTRKRMNPFLSLLLILLVALGGVAFAKFAVIDLYQAVAAADAKANEAMATYEAYCAYTDGYDALYEEYRKNCDGGLTEQESALVDIPDAIKMVDSEIASKAIVEAYTISDNTVTMTVSGITLGELSKMIGSLSQNDLVMTVAVTTAEGGTTTIVYYQNSIIPEIESTTTSTTDEVTAKIVLALSKNAGGDAE